jgi:dihydrodipicolinate synthase/N-acetylneuraminate lyase
MPIPSIDPIVVAPSPTPFREDDSVDCAAIERNVQRWLETPLSGFVLNSENGEEAFLSERERLEIVRTVNHARDGRKFIIGGVDSSSVTETLRIAEALVEAGADLLRIRIPRLTANVRGYFEQVIPRAAAPVVVIHQMAPGKFLSTSPTIGAPAELIGEIVAMENVFGYITSDNLRFESRVRQLVPDDKRFWISNGSLLLPGAALGCNGGCMMLCNVATEECRDVIQGIMQGDLQTARVLQARLLELDWQILTRGSAGLKAALNMLGFETGNPRAPQPSCDAAVMAQIREALRHAGLLTEGNLDR